MRIGLRTVVYVLAAAAVAAALRFTPRIPERSPAEVLVAQAAAPSWRMRFDTLGRGENLQALLRRGGLSDAEAREAISAATSLDHRRIPAGMPVTIRAEHADSAPSEITL
jgi:hypothetical protein